jgi:phage shock protein PspC (stress-responsive transcriptional regulator)
MILGVCSKLAEKLNTDVKIVRASFVILGLVTFIPVPLYFVLAIIFSFDKK